MRVLRERLGWARARIAPGAGGFWVWWKSALRSWLPARWQVALGVADARLLLAARQDGIEVLYAREGCMRALALLPAQADPALLATSVPAREARLPRFVLLPGDAVLRRSVRLPAAAEGRLHDVLRFEIDRQTPFSAEQVHFDVRLLGRRADGQLEAELVVVPRHALETLLSPNDAWRGQFDGVDVAAADGAPLSVNLLPPAQRRKWRDPMRRLDRLLLLAALVLLVLAAWQWLDNRRKAAAQLAAQVEASAIRARAVSAQRQQLQDLVDGRAFFTQQRAQQATATEVINELSRRLGDDTWLEKLSIDNGRMQLIGLSNSASSLVSQLEGATLWKTPSLTGVLQAGDGSARERFTLTAELRAPRQEAADGAATQSP